MKGRILSPHFISYQLIISLKREVEIMVGRLGENIFPPGIYVYTGSAKRNISSRIARHLKKAKKPHWHIDYLLQNPEATVIRTRKSRKKECLLNKSTKGVAVVPGFGSSDCKNGCESHLKLVSRL